MTIDAHQHFWRFDPVRDAWIDPQSMSVLRRDFMPSDLQPLLAAAGIDACIAVQADQSEVETDFLLDLAAQNPFIVGVVGWVDLRADDLSGRLARWAGQSALRGFRHILQGEQLEFMLQPDFLRGIRTIGQAGFTYDILVFPRHLRAVQQLLRQADAQPFVIDHLAKPYIRRGLYKQWAVDLRRIARYPNVFCKLSGMVTEADWKSWRAADLTNYLEIALDCFGPQRLLYGSDWPVCLLAADYSGQLSPIHAFINRLSPAEQARIMGANAREVYGVRI